MQILNGLFMSNGKKSAAGRARTFGVGLACFSAILLLSACRDSATPFSSPTEVVAGSYVQKDQNGRAVMTLSIDRGASGLSIHMADPETNEAGSLRGCLLLAEATSPAHGTGEILAKGVDISSDACSLRISPRSEGVVDVLAAGCEESCVSPDVAALLSGSYALTTVATNYGQNLNAQPEAPIDQAPIQVELTGEVIRSGLWLNSVKVVSLVDDVTIQDIVINRGNCKLIGTGESQLGFGQSTTYVTTPGCPDILEVEVITNLGVWAFPFR